MPANRPRRPQDPEPPSNPPRKGRLNNLELAGIGLFCLALMLYGISRCNRQPEPPAPSPSPSITEQVLDTTPVQPTAPQPNLPVESVPDSLVVARTLYVLVDSLRLRESPALNGKVLGYLKYGEGVLDLGVQSELKRLRISVEETRTAPWVKIQTKNGKIGWTFGAYLQIYPVPRVTEGAAQ